MQTARATLPSFIVHAADLSAANPFANCPFDSSRIEIVRADPQGNEVGDTVHFLHTNARYLTGEIAAIGMNARDADGIPFTAVLVKKGHALTVKPAADLHSVLEHPDRFGSYHQFRAHDTHGCL